MDILMTSYDRQMPPMRTLGMICERLVGRDLCGGNLSCYGHNANDMSLTPVIIARS